LFQFMSKHRTCDDCHGPNDGSQYKKKFIHERIIFKILLQQTDK
jgi:hypothetical protein